MYPWVMKVLFDAKSTFSNYINSQIRVNYYEYESRNYRTKLDNSHYDAQIHALPNTNFISLGSPSALVECDKIKIRRHTIVGRIEWNGSYLNSKLFETSRE